jgi:4'-phosphopantetheinyl transferase
MDLPTAFEHALPSARWPLSARHGTLAVFIAAADWARWDAEAFELLDAGERDRVQRKRRPEDRALTTLAYVCHRLLLSAVLECAPREVGLGRDGRGCPIVAGDRLMTSLSHAEGLVAIAVSSGGPVGIDIEPAIRAGDMGEIAGRVCHPRELAALSALPDSQRERALLSLWVRKEALLKAAGIGMEVEMDRFEAPANRVLGLPGGVRAGTVAIRLFDGGERYVAAVAAAPGEIGSAWLAPAG